MKVRDLVADIKAQVNGESDLLTKQASGSSTVSSLSPEQLLTLADRIEKAGHTQEASQKIVEMRKASQEADTLTDVELKKLAYRQALRELGFKGASISPLSLLFGDMSKAQDRLAKQAADAASSLISEAVKAGLSADEEADGE